MSARAWTRYGPAVDERTAPVGDPRRIPALPPGVELYRLGAEHVVLSLGSAACTLIDAGRPVEVTLEPAGPR